MYDVLVDVAPALTARFEAYMRVRHIPQILATGCFSEIRFQRSDKGRFRTSYAAADRADLDRYLAEHTAGLRADFAAEFPDGVSASREVWSDLETWSR